MGTHTTPLADTNQAMVISSNNNNPMKRSSRPAATASAVSSPSVQRNQPTAHAISPRSIPHDETALLKLQPLTRQSCCTHLINQCHPIPDCPDSHRPITLKLSPVHNVDEDPSIVFHARKFDDGSVAASVLLGRNPTTGIQMSSVSRALCELSFSRSDKNNTIAKKDGQSWLVAILSMRKAPGMHAVHIDGVAVDKPLGRTIPIKDGSIISLWGPLGFAYLVQILNRDDAQQKQKAHSKSVSLKRKAVEPPSSSKQLSAHKEIRKRGHQLMVEEQTCSLCMDILIKSTFAYPCGHAFCSDCTEKCKTMCPNCRGKIQGWMPARSYDTIIWATALQGCFDPDDARVYLERRKVKGEADATTEELECIMGDVKANANGKGYCISSPTRNNNHSITMPIQMMPPIFSTNSFAAFPERLTTSTVAANSGKKGTSVDDAICLDGP